MMMQAALFQPHISQAIESAQVVSDSLRHDQSRQGLLDRTRANLVLSSAESQRLRPEAAETHARIAEGRAAELDGPAAKRLQIEARLRMLYCSRDVGEGTAALEGYIRVAQSLADSPEMVDLRLVALAKAIGMAVALPDRYTAEQLIDIADELQPAIGNPDVIARFRLSKAYYLTTGFDPEGARHLLERVEAMPLQDNRIRVCARLAQAAVHYLREETDAGDECLDENCNNARHSGLLRTAIHGREIIERFRPQPRVPLV